MVKIKLGISFGLCGIALALSSLAMAETVSQKPNVILIYADDLGWGDLSCYGATKVQTPHIDAVASNGLRFTNAHCTAATCTPSRYSIMTGKYAWRDKGTGILPGDAGLIVPTNEMTLGKVFQDAGYQTACVGKWHMGLGKTGELDWNKEIRPDLRDVGFHEYFIFPATADRVPTVYVQNGKVLATDPADPIQVSYEEKIGTEPTGKENPELLKMAASKDHGHDGTIVNGIGRIGWMTGGNKARWTDESLAGDFTQEAEEFIERNAEKPFFLYFATSDIHVPRMPGTRFKGKSELGYRGDAILQLDYTVGRISQKLKDLELTSNTMIIISSDNGPVLSDGYDDEAVSKSLGHKAAGPYRGGKYSMLEGGARVSYIVSWPARIKPGVSGALVSQVDLKSSFAGLLGVKIPDGQVYDGLDMHKTMIGEDKVGRESLVVHAASFALIEGKYKFIRPKKGKAFLERTQIETGLMNEPQLYDLEADPEERNNLAGSEPEKLNVMREKLKSIAGGNESSEFAE